MFLQNTAHFLRNTYLMIYTLPPCLLYGFEWAKINFFAVLQAKTSQRFCRSTDQQPPPNMVSNSVATRYKS
ncbi:hypothetical protein BDV40DRAFT_34716 [Aspergillus tamarii]|uniref:Uncharacterized protein n=1 Tax=Aspergillus tamarii TaxID=41984 RepID=A0A5N6UH99_ASPTM|nr:hypothetical protein BDV40DRAFT_34716 [Aspergillus tamarii]